MVSGVFFFFFLASLGLGIFRDFYFIFPVETVVNHSKTAMG